MNVLVTGGAGFIGGHLCAHLLMRGDQVWVVDNFDPFYDPAIKLATVGALQESSRFHMVPADIRDPQGMDAALRAAAAESFDVIVHLAARAGVRPSIEDPLLYSQVNLDGTVAMLELARRRGVRNFVFGSSSSVYGNSDTVPFSEDQPVDRPISPYAATKRAGELLCHTYHHLWGMSIVCLRFFTVYGPRQRPDLAIHKFTRAMARGETVPMFGDGSTERDYTYVDDIVAGVVAAMEYTATHEGCWEIFNLGGSRTTSLLRMIQLIGDSLGVRPTIQRLPMQPGDVVRTFADVRKSAAMLGYAPATPIEEGIEKFVAWYQGRAADRVAVPAVVGAFSAASSTSSF